MFIILCKLQKSEYLIVLLISFNQPAMIAGGYSLQVASKPKLIFNDDATRNVSIDYSLILKLGEFVIG